MRPNDDYFRCSHSKKVLASHAVLHSETIRNIITAHRHTTRGGGGHVLRGTSEKNHVIICTIEYNFARKHALYRSQNNWNRIHLIRGERAHWSCHRINTTENLSWNQFINYHIIKFKYKYYMVLCYVAGALPWTLYRTYCIIHWPLHAFITHIVSTKHFKWQIMRFIINEP